MNDRLHPVEGDRVGVADVEAKVGELRMLQQVTAEPLGVDAYHFMAIGQQQGHQDGALVAAAAGNKNVHNVDKILGSF